MAGDHNAGEQVSNVTAPCEDDWLVELRARFADRKLRIVWRSFRREHHLDRKAGCVAALDGPRTSADPETLASIWNWPQLVADAPRSTARSAGGCGGFAR